MKKQYISPTIRTYRASTQQPLAGSNPPGFGGKLGSRYHNKLWDEDEDWEDFDIE